MWQMIGSIVGGMLSSGGQKEPWAEGRQNFDRMFAQSQASTQADLHQPQPVPVSGGPGGGGNRFDPQQFMKFLDLFKKNPYEMGKNPWEFDNVSDSQGQGGGFWSGMWKGLGS